MNNKGRTITIKINGKAVETTIGEDGLQYLPNRPIIRYLMHRAALDFNELATLNQCGMVSDDDYRFIYQNIGFSIGGYMETLRGDDIENPYSDGSTA